MPQTTAHSPLYLASSNPGKLREFRDAGLAHGIPIEPLPLFKTLPICIEDGATFEENARKKALHYSAYVSGAVFADDSGISVDALGGAPGIFSARFARPDATDAENNCKLIEELRRADDELRLAHEFVEKYERLRCPLQGREPPPSQYEPIRRLAHYVCVIALAQSGRVLCLTEGRADGVILDGPRGTGGFGYDPYFYFPPLGKTFAELRPDEKFAVSHRGKAFRQLLEQIESPAAGSC